MVRIAVLGNYHENVIGPLRVMHDAWHDAQGARAGSSRTPSSFWRPVALLLRVAVEAIIPPTLGMETLLRLLLQNRVKGENNERKGRVDPGVVFPLVLRRPSGSCILRFQRGKQ